jgi:hypothetical protein
MDIDKKEIIEKTMKIVFDGKQYLVRFPTEISEVIELKNYKVKFKIELPKEGEIKGEILSIKLVEYKHD